MKIEVTLVPDGVDEDGEPMFVKLDEAIAQAADGHIKARVEKLVAGKIVEQMVELIRDRIDPLVEEAFLKPIQRTSEWGTAIGEPVTLTELVMDVAKGYCQERVGSDGRPSTYTGSVPRLEQFARTAAEAVCKEQMDKHVKALRDQFASVVADQVAKASGK